MQSFGFRGVQVHKKVDHMIGLDDTSHVNSGINPNHVDTHCELGRPLTAGEITNLGCVWGAMQWQVTRVVPHHAAALSKMQSKFSQPTLRLIKETKKLVSHVKLSETHLTIHLFF